MMTPRQRVNDLITSQTEGILVSFWRHFYTEEFELSRYISAMLRFYETYRWDFLKLNPRSSYHNEAWGVQYKPPNTPYEKPVLQYTPVEKLEDWPRVIKRIPADTGVFLEQLDAIRSIRQNLGQDVPIVQTLFSPLEVMSRFLPHKEDLAVFLRHEHERFIDVIEIITDVLTEFALNSIDAGADGIFFATTWATRKTTDAIFQTFERPYDLRLLNRIRPHANLIILHVCGFQPRVLEMLDYPFDMIHWDWTNPENPPYTDVEAQDNRPIIGGVPGKGLLQYGAPYRVYDYIERSIHPRRWVVSAECTFPPETPEENLWAVRKAVADLRQEIWPGNG